MKVYVVMQDVPYGSCDVVAIYKDEIKANQAADVLAAETPQWGYSVEEFKVQE